MQKLEKLKKVYTTVIPCKVNKKINNFNTSKQMGIINDNITG